MVINHEIITSKIMQHFIDKEATMEDQTYKYYINYEYDNCNLNSFEFVSSFNAIVIKSKLPSEDIGIIMKILYQIYENYYWALDLDIYDTEVIIDTYNSIYGYNIEKIDDVDENMITNYDDSNCIKFWIKILDETACEIDKYDHLINSEEFMRTCNISVKNKRFIEYKQDDKNHLYSFQQIVLGVKDINKEFVNNIEVILTKHK